MPELCQRLLLDLLKCVIDPINHRLSARLNLLLLWPFLLFPRALLLRRQVFSSA